MSDTADTGSLPMTEPHMAPIFDTGPHPIPIPEPPQEIAGLIEPPRPVSKLQSARSTPVTPVMVAGHYRYVKWWQLALVLIGVWVPAAGIGLGLFSWWYSLADKTPAVFAVLVYAVVCVVAGLIVAMAAEKPLASAVAIAVMSAVFASAVAAAPLYGHHFCAHVSRCVGGILPY